MIAYIPFLAALAASVSAAPAPSIGSRSCASGFTAGSTSTTITLAVPMGTIAPVIQSFFNATWEGITVTSTNGTDNKIGSTRSFLSGGILPVTEQLLDSTEDSPYVIERVWTGIGGATRGDTLPITAPSANFTIDSWTESFTLSPTCSFKATEWTWSASYCTNNNTVAHEAYTAAHTGPLDALAATYGNTTSC
ncbi:hypothetical protein FIBSPDRAFT_932594 [Athelia psychrophila]|uniref:Uncharacterized protein n=1 Tax=Athelia psychrophila TaxID=1759441 RepID=A0A166IGX2_9AGAM|nr:hypothetical protein FIBSPDRAFT_932594 [Fibularhizoctonia sp. CBS 109695]